MTKLAYPIAAMVPLAAGFVATEAPAQQRQIAEIVVYGNDPCPRSTDDEVVVCARRPESERYRLPEAQRDAGPIQERRPWVSRARTLETVSDTGINSCSAVGPAGYTGCLEQLIGQAGRERREEIEADVPPEQP